MKFHLMVIIMLCAFFVSQQSFATAHNTLVIVNDNSIDSVAVGTYYADKRNVPSSNIVHVLSRPSFFTDWSDFLSLRDQIIKFMQSRMQAETGITPEVCNNTPSKYYCAESMTQLRENTSVRYLVTTRGVPTRMVVNYSMLSGLALEGPTAPTSIDNYLRHWLINYYDSDVVFSSLKRAEAFKDGRGMRIVDPSNDKELIVGRIDGLDLSSAKQLVDRAISAESNGVYGKLYSHKFGIEAGKGRWYDYEANKFVYGDNATSWKYQHGIFGDFFSAASSGYRFTSDNACLDHLDNDNNSPESCVVRLAGNVVPANTSSLVPNPESALVYLGSLDGHATTGTFNDFLNWQKGASCTDTFLLCRDSATPAVCKASSTDIFKEINTDCVGVKEGFIGYNYQSFPVSYLAVWPTSWNKSRGIGEQQWSKQDTGDLNNLAFPEIYHGDSADGDGASLWFRNNDQIADPQCYSDDNMATTYTCPEERKISITNTSLFTARTYNSAAPQTYKITFRYKSKNIEYIGDALKLRARLLLHEPGKGQFQVDYGVYDFEIPGEGIVHQIPTGDVNEWTLLQTTLTIDEVKHSDVWDGQYDGLKIIFGTESATNEFSGELGIDNFEVVSINSNDEMAISNPSFTKGHEQVSAGDHAANFLSRLNGTAFWGSLSHHQSSGHSFAKHPLETLIYFTRGLPLGDAVWFAENNNSGILYGDPLYSPIAVRLDYPSRSDNFITGNYLISGDAVNGLDAETNYEVHYCNGSDFIICDKNNAWSSGPIGAGEGGKGINFLDWDTSSVAPGEYVIRLSVLSQHPDQLTSQTFYDYSSIIVYDSGSDFDNDGLLDIDEILSATDPSIDHRPFITSYNSGTSSDVLIVGMNAFVYGYNLCGEPCDPSTISISGVEVSVYLYPATDTSIGFVVPDGAVSGPMVVTTNIDSISKNIIIASPPVITSFNPGGGNTFEVGENAIIHGNNFCGVSCDSSTTSVSISGVVVTDYHWVADEIMVFVIPDGAVTGPMVVTTEAGSAPPVEIVIGEPAV